MKKILATAALYFLPVVALAAEEDGTGDLIGATTGFTGIINSLTNAANALIPFFLAIAVVVFIYGIIKYILATGADDKAVARGYIIYGIIGIAVIVSLFGVIRLLQNTLGIDPDEAGSYPQFNPAPDDAGVDNLIDEI